MPSSVDSIAAMSSHSPSVRLTNRSYRITSASSGRAISRIALSSMVIRRAITSSSIFSRSGTLDFATASAIRLHSVGSSALQSPDPLIPRVCCFC
jgi:hypothetical protein